MSTKARLPFQPAILDALQISADGDLAYAFDNKIFIQTLNYNKLFPCWQIDHQPIQSPLPWTIINFKVGRSFTNEILRDFSESFDTLSIGQVQSHGAVLRHSWSRARVGKLNRQVLAILTSRLELQLWEATEAPNLADSWQQVASVHEILRQHLNSQDDIEPLLLKKRSRLRAYDWSFPVDVENVVQLLAITNDNNEVFILRIPQTSDIPQNISIIDMFVAHGIPMARDLVGSLAASREETFVGKIAWSPWVQDAQGVRKCLIAYASRGLVKLRSLIIKLEDAASCRIQDLEIILGEASSRRHEIRSMTWSDTLNDNAFVLAFETLGVVVISYIAPDGVVLSTKRVNNPHWDPPTGTFFVSTSKDNDLMQYHLVTANGNAIVLDVPCSWQSMNEVAIMDSVAPTWQRELEGELKTFDSGRELGGTAVTRVWGMSVTPLSGHAVLNASFHPSDMLEYMIPIQEVSTTLFDKELGGLGSWARDVTSLFSSQVSTEGLLTDIGLQSLQSPDRESSSTALTTVHQLLKEYLNELLIGGKLPPVTFPPFDKASGMQQQISSILTTNPLKSARLLNVFSNFGQESANSQYADLLRSHLKTIQAHVALPLAFLKLPCPICDLPLLGRSLHADGRYMNVDGFRETEKEESLAVCTNGHVFKSCPISGVPICGLAQSRYCRVCGLEYLSDAGAEHLTQVSNQSDENKELLLSLIRACVECFYCGGRFVGKRI